MPSNTQRHASRDRCSYCGAEMGLLPVPGVSGKYRETQETRKTWDHILPASVGGKITIPCCGLCNSKKGDLSLREFLDSGWLFQRREFVMGGWKSKALPWLNEAILRNIEQEDLIAAKRRLKDALQRLETWG